MKKILIISYFFPPSTFTGSFRIYSWAKYLSRFGWYPIVVTRRWDFPVSEYKDMSATTSSEILHQQFDGYEVYSLPYKGNLRDRLHEKYGERKMVTFRKMLSFFEVIGQNFTTRVVPFRNLYIFSDDLLKKDPDIKCMITSGKPYVLFSFCHKLSKKHHIPWVSDYRDDWSTSQWLTNLSFRDRLIANLEKRSELKWLASASGFTTISPAYVDLITGFIKKPGFSIMNGFDPDDYAGLPETTGNKAFTIIFNGTLYESQPVEIFTEAFRKFVHTAASKGDIKLLFLGLDFEKQQADRVRGLLQGLEPYYQITGRVEKKKALEIMAAAHVFLMFSHTNIKGVTSSKIFDYLALGKPVILSPGDKEILEEIIHTTHSGFVCENSEKTLLILQALFDEYISTGKISDQRDMKAITNYSRINQTKKLAEALNTLI
ncbi:MAG TPA: glycosyltransferase [Bacteroidales bacterium]|nr:glycosyltransferase [Bacteroidales bacterium]HQP14602.1 glycosyltransferase [Bacteroidales bacterium]